MNKFNPNDPKLWQGYNPNETGSDEFVDGKSQTRVNRSISASIKKNNAIFSDKMSEVAVVRNQDPEYLESLRVGIAHRDNTYQAESNAKPEVKAKISKSLTGKAKSAEHKKALKATTTNKPGDEKWVAAHKAGLAKRDKPFHAGEYGIFASIAEAARVVESEGKLKNAYKKFSQWKKDGKDGYYFIEEAK